MKKCILTLMLGMSMAVFGQTETIDTARVVVKYDYACQTLDDEGTPVTDRMQIVVQVGQTVTKSMPLSVYQRTDKQTRADVATAHQEALLHMPTLWMDYPKGQTTVREFMFPHEYEGYEPTPVIEWVLADDTLTVSGYLCQRATTKFRGMEWHVWYTEDIPSPAGPWRLHGLPGLIVKAESEVHAFCLAELRQEQESITAPEHHPEVQRLKYGRLLKFRNETFGNRQYPKNPTYYVPDLRASINRITVFNHGDQKLAFANGQPLLMKAHVYQPLEME